MPYTLLHIFVLMRYREWMVELAKLPLEKFSWIKKKISGLRFRSSVFSANCSFLRTKRAKVQISLAALFKLATGANGVFYKEQEERWRAICSYVLGIKRGKACWKEQRAWGPVGGLILENFIQSGANLRTKIVYQWT